MVVGLEGGSLRVSCRNGKGSKERTMKKNVKPLHRTSLGRLWQRLCGVQRESRVVVGRVRAGEAVCTHVLPPQKLGASHGWDNMFLTSISCCLGAAILRGSSSVP